VNNGTSNLHSILRFVAGTGSLMLKISPSTLSLVASLAFDVPRRSCIILKACEGSNAAQRAFFENGGVFGVSAVKTWCF